MNGPYFSLDGSLHPVEEALIPLDDQDFYYGYGVYETLKVRSGVLYFPELHEDRLLHSARVIGLAHGLKPGHFTNWTRDLVRANQIQDGNLRAILVGNAGEARARFIILAQDPVFPDPRLYEEGAAVITWEGERFYPQAKTLNMLVSTLAYRRAQTGGAYDALLINRRGEVTEGTRTNLFATDGRQVISPPADDILEGVTKLTLALVLKDLGIPLIHRPLRREELLGGQSWFLTSTSTKIVPMAAVDGQPLPLSPLVKTLMEAYDHFLDRWAAEHGRGIDS